MAKLCSEAATPGPRGQLALCRLNRYGGYFLYGKNLGVVFFRSESTKYPEIEKRTFHKRSTDVPQTFHKRSHNLGYNRPPGFQGIHGNRCNRQPGRGAPTNNHPRNVPQGICIKNNPHMYSAVCCGFPWEPPEKAICFNRHVILGLWCGPSPPG